MAKAPQLARARQARRARTDDGDGPSGWHTGLEQLEIVLEDMIRRVALQQRDLDRRFVPVIQHAGSLTQHLYRTRARAGVAEGIRLEDHARRAAQIAGRNFLDEGRDVDVCRAGDGAGGVVTEEAFVRFEQRVIVRQRRRDVGEVRRQLCVA